MFHYSKLFERVEVALRPRKSVSFFFLSTVEKDACAQEVLSVSAQDSSDVLAIFFYFFSCFLFRQGFADTVLYANEIILIIIIL